MALNHLWIAELTVIWLSIELVGSELALNTYLSNNQWTKQYIIAVLLRTKLDGEL